MPAAAGAVVKKREVSIRKIETRSGGGGGRGAKYIVHARAVSHTVGVGVDVRQAIQRLCATRIRQCPRCL